MRVDGVYWKGVGSSGAKKRFYKRVVGVGEPRGLLYLANLFLSACQLLTANFASAPNTRSSRFHPTTLAIFRLLSLSKTTSKGTPGLMRESFVNSAP